MARGFQSQFFVFSELTIAGLLCLSCNGAAGAVNSWVELGPADGLALDQPRVTFGLAHPGTDILVGPEIFNMALLDTGANGILLAKLSFEDPASDPYLPYYPAQRPDSSVVQYQEQGVAGTSLLTVLQPYDLRVTGDTAAREYVVPHINAFGSSTLDIGSFSAIVGMPAMQGRLTELNLQAMVQTNFISVDFPETMSAPNGTGNRYAVPLTLLPAIHTGQMQPDDPLPTFADLPMLTQVRTDYNTGTITGDMLLDTGAQTTIISQATAAALGIDFSRTIAEGGHVIDMLEVGGVGGTVMMPMVMIDRLALPSAAGVDLVWTDIAVGVLDIPGISGVFGMNMLTSGYTNSVLGGGEGTSDADLLGFLLDLIDMGILPEGTTIEDLRELLGNSATGAMDPFFEKVLLDFTVPGNPTMYLDMNPVLNHVVPEPATAFLLLTLTPLTLLRQGRRR